MEAGKEKAGLIARVAAAGLILAAAWGKVPMPTLPSAAVPVVRVETPSVEMQAVVAPVAAALSGMNAVDRAVWAEAWTKAALVVEGDGVSEEVAFTDTRSLRAYTALALDIAWRRIHGKPPEDETLRVAVEKAYAQGIGLAVVSVTKDIRKQYAEFARAMAWAGFGKG